MYYLRTRAAADAIKFTVDQQALAKRKAAQGTTTSAAKTEVLKVTFAAAFACLISEANTSLPTGCWLPQVAVCCDAQEGYSW